MYAWLKLNSVLTEDLQLQTRKKTARRRLRACSLSWGLNVIDTVWPSGFTVMSASVLCAKGQTDELPSVSRLLQVSVFMQITSDPGTRIIASGLLRFRAFFDDLVHVPRIIHRTLQHAKEGKNSPRLKFYCTVIFAAAAAAAVATSPSDLCIRASLFISRWRDLLVSCLTIVLSLIYVTNEERRGDR